MSDHWLYVGAAYLLTIAGTGGLVLWAYQAMRAAERRAEELGR